MDGYDNAALSDLFYKCFGGKFVLLEGDFIIFVL